MGCEVYEGESTLSTLLGAGLAVGIFASYVPQQIVIVQRQTTEGLNPYYLLLMNLGSGLSFANILVLTRPVWPCCVNYLAFLPCTGALMSLFQIGAGFLGPVITMALAYRYRYGPGGDARVVGDCGKAIILIHSLIIATAILTPIQYARVLATSFGLGALSIGLVQYFPQIWTTWHLKHAGSLSLATMAIQIPGGYLWCLSLASRKGSHWSTWLSLFSAASLQLVLLCMALYYQTSMAVATAEAMPTPPPDIRVLSARYSEEQPLLEPSQPAP